MGLNEQSIAEHDFLKDLPWLTKNFFGNSVYAYLLTIVSFVAIWAVLYFSRAYVHRKVAKAVEDGRGETWSFFRDLIFQLKPYTFPMLALYFALQRLSLPSSFEKGLHFIVLAAVTVQVVRIFIELLAFTIMRSRTLGRADDLAVKNTSQNIIVLLKVAIWTGTLLFLLDNAGFNVSTFVAGLGIGGVAIALAAQAILGDTFSSFAIALDKPFEVGDFIIVDKLAGTVEHIGLKTTRVRSVGGELLIFSNSDLTKSRIQNFKRMFERRTVFRIGIAYETASATLRKIPDMLKEIVESMPDTRFDRAHMYTFGEQALCFEIAYFVLKPEFKAAMDIQQSINFKVRETLETAGIAMAYAPPP